MELRASDARRRSTVRTDPWEAHRPTRSAFRAAAGNRAGKMRNVQRRQLTALTVNFLT
jgi:uncharacterized protein YfiM (DUF2279 family)